MRKINLNEITKNTFSNIVPKEQLKEINGGCSRITIGRCLKNGKLFVASVSGVCGNYSTHLQYAKNSAASSSMTNGQYYDWPSGHIHG